MGAFEFKDRRYEVDDEGFLRDPSKWDEQFAEGAASHNGIPGGLTDSHWKIIKFIRERVGSTGKCPVIYEICRIFKLRLPDLKELFPTGYQRGACKLAGLTCCEGLIHSPWLPQKRSTSVSTPVCERVYEVDILGFLMDPSGWDEEFAICKSEEMKMQGLTEEHWKVIDFLRQRHQKDGKVPTVYDTCESNRISIEAMEELFPDGYHRGAVKIAGLRAR